MIFAPQIKTPQESAVYNLGVVTIEWDRNNPPADDSNITTDSITYEIEYTDNYKGEDSNWYTLKRRILWDDTFYAWKVGKMIKSPSVRIRMRARTTYNESVSDWSISDQFVINVFKLLPPAIVSPISKRLYTDFIMIILDETLTKNTFNQKVRYTLEYSSQKRDIDWTLIIKDLPAGQNVVRWNIETLPTSDDYVIRLTAKNSNCYKKPDDNPHQFARRFIYDIQIQQSGVFLIDTKPPDSILEIENSTGVTNDLDQIINVFAQDETTQVENIQMRECNASDILVLGEIETEEEDCPPISELLAAPNVDFGRLIGKPRSNTSKIHWKLEDKSGLRKIEALLTDSGGNSSLQEKIRVFMSVFRANNKISDFIIVFEQRDKVTIDQTTTPPVIVTTSSTLEVILVGTSNEIWSLEPFPRMLYKIDEEIVRLIEFNDTVYILSYNATADISSVYRHDITKATKLQEFTNDRSKIMDVDVFEDALYIGLENGELWKYNGSAFSLLSLPVSDSINSLSADESYLYIGLINSANLILYNGSKFFTLDIEP